MQRQRRLSFLNACLQLGIDDNDVNNVEELPNSDGEEVLEIDGNDDDEEYAPEVELAEVELFEEETNSGSESDNDSSEEDNQLENNEIITPIVRYRTDGFEQRLRRRNLLTQQPRCVANPDNEEEAFKLFYTDDIIMKILRDTNKKREMNAENAIYN